MNYSQKYFDEIFEGMLQDSLEKGLISHADEFQSYIQNQQDISNYYVMDKAVIAQMFTKVYEDITSVYNSINIDIAESEDLDHIGAIVGMNRPAATYSMCEVTFTIIADSDENITIDSGVIISTNMGIQYRTVEEIFIPSGESECTVAAIAVEPGVNSKVAENTLTIINDNISNLTVTNHMSSSGGTDEYTDDEYRELLKNWRLVNLKGSVESFEEYFANFDGIDGYKIVPNWDGSGTVKIILDPGYSVQLNQAYTELHENICQIDTDISLFAPLEKFIDVYATVNVDIDRVNPYSSVEKENIQSKIISAIKVFIDGGYRVNGNYYTGLKIGEDFIPHKLAVFLDAEVQELKNIDFTYPTEPINILDEEKGKSNTINIEMI